MALISYSTYMSGAFLVNQKILTAHVLSDELNTLCVGVEDVCKHLNLNIKFKIGK